MDSCWQLSGRPCSPSIIYLLDEPTTGLHFDDVLKLIAVLNDLVAKDNTVVVIEHNLDVIKSADWIIDLGPAGRNEGGWLVAGAGRRHTVSFLKKMLVKA
jgi:excinuclease ABC subunit A